ncbi:MAG: flagellar assembly protein FliW [Spirochaetales bacterium]|nr:flagellar assembly protein FliW [Exilispira sp.]NMC66885.1 flagellar assembly protein FliW [Spirochaetales bacterium]
MNKNSTTIIKNINLGSFKVDESQKLYFDDGIFGFEHIKEYYLIDANLAPFMLLQSLEDEAIGFIVCDPFLFFSDYEFDLSDEAKNLLELEKSTDLLVLVIVTLSDKIEEVSANLVGPIVINIKTHKAMQYIINNPKYTTKHYLFSK